MFSGEQFDQFAEVQRLVSFEISFLGQTHCKKKLFSTNERIRQINKLFIDLKPLRTFQCLSCVCQSTENFQNSPANQQM